MEQFTSYRDNCGFGLLASIDNKPSHQNVEDAIKALERMMHRGAIAADGKSGDGSGLLFSMPHKFFKKLSAQEDFILPATYAVAMVFYKNESNLEVIKEYCAKNDLKILHIRKVPINTQALGELAKKTLPNIVQIFVAPSSLIATKRFEALLYLTRREIEKALEEDEDFYIPSFSSKTIAYKGLVMPTYIKMFYPDLQDKDFEASFALFHQRFSTNTLPKWKLAQPFRMIAHNGEINSVTANRYNVLAKCEALKSEVFSDEEIQRILPVLEKEASDSKSLDNFFEFLIVNGIDFFKAIRALIPAPWQNAPHMDAQLRAFYEYTSTCFEAWDGPAAVSLTDGRYVGCVLDRNGLRPAKYIITTDNRLIIASEYGILQIPEEKIIERGRLQSGEMIALDLKYGVVLKNEDINDYLKNSNPYTEWLNEHMVYLQEHIDQQPFTNLKEYEVEDLVHKQRFYNITHELIEQVIEPMIKEGKEAVGSMGDDTPLAAFSHHQRSFTDFFKQKFAQVTNPPIDPIREKIVMSLNTGFGEIHNILDEDPEHAVRLKAVSPILVKEKIDVLLSYGDPKHPRYRECFKHKFFSTAFEKDLKASLEALVEEIVTSVKEEGVRIIVLDDRNLSPSKKTIPMAMVVGRLNKRLLEEGVRHLTSTVAITAEVHDSHSAAVMVAYGASAVYPYLLFATVYEKLKKQDLTQYELRNRFKNVINALNGGFLKIMSKMGISTIASYRNSSLFDVIGLSKEVVQDCFPNSACLLGGLGYEDIEERLERYHKKAYEVDIQNRLFPLELGGFYKYIAQSEYHDFNPNTVNQIHTVAVTRSWSEYKKLKQMVDGRGKKFIRDFFELESPRDPIPLQEVEPIEEIFKRFDSAAMSLGSISPEAHECIAEAMNSIGAKSNSGEGGEDESRFG
ncbi:MAG: glutamate synthase large subunit, partial [Epsilonproteobacteria bacterium]|nr:glutamate synthase large subunit [Campylobacterota bacterium]